MEAKGYLTGIVRNLATGKIQVTFQMDTDVSHDLQFDESAPLRISVKKWREKRSLDANGLLWHCIDQIAEALNTDKWSVYLIMLKRYGQFTYIIVKEEAVEAVKAGWRECEVVGEISVNGTKAVQMLCYFGSSTYDTKEFSRLLNGVISEMECMGLEPPPSSEMKRVLDELDKITKEKEKT